jgi:hypothetical protein
VPVLRKANDARKVEGKHAGEPVGQELESFKGCGEFICEVLYLKKPHRGADLVECAW